MRRLLMLAALALVAEAALAREFAWTLRTAGGDEYAGYALDRLSGDSLFIARPTGHTEFVLVDSIASLRRERRGAVLPATIIAGVGGGVAGYALKPVARDQEQANVYSAAFGVIVGSVAGYLIASLIEHDEVIEVYRMNREERFQHLQGLLLSE